MVLNKIKGAKMLSNKEIINYIERDIKTLSEHYKKCQNRSAKEPIREKLIFTKLKKLSIESNCKYLKEAYTLLKSEDLFKAEDALNLLNSIDRKILKRDRVNYILFKALLNELLIKYMDATLEYKKALKISFNKETVDMYREFLQRTKCDNQICAHSDTLSISEDIDKLKKSAKSLESIAKYYIKSSKSIKLAQDYYYKSLTIYKKMKDIDSRFVKEYILSLIKAVETFKMKKELLLDAEKLIFHTKECQGSEMYLLNKIKVLKESN